MPPETAIVLPSGVNDPRAHMQEGAERVTIDNQTELPDRVVEEAVEDVFVENASLGWGHQTTFQTYSSQGSLLARRPFQTPANVIDEIRLARDLAERDDDVAATIGQLIALAFGEGMENQHSDPRTKAIFDAICREADMDAVLSDLYRELLIAGQVNSATLFTRGNLDYELPGSKQTTTTSVAAPLIGVIHAENIRIVGNDLFKTGTLCYTPENERLRRWLDEYFNPTTSPAKKAQLGLQDRISANLFTGVVEVNALDYDIPPVHGNRLYVLNPRMVQRSTFPKGSWKYPRPMLTRDFALLEAKRLLNVLDFALLQGGSNFIIVAKKGSDQRPAQKPEIDALSQAVARASRTGVIVGDHRLSFEVITPRMDELLNPEKRQLIGRKLVMSMLRVTEALEERDATGMLEILARVATSDRRLVKRHVENNIYGETAKRNPNTLKGTAAVWFSKIILQGSQFFTDYVLKLRDRGDIPRAWAVEAAGFDFDAAVQQRKFELASGADEIMVPGAVPHSSPDAGPQDNNSGRPTGTGDGQTSVDGARPRKTIQQNKGETIKAWYEDEYDTTVRMGEITLSVLDQHPERDIGRITGTERASLEGDQEVAQHGATIYVPVNGEYACTQHKVVALREGLRMVIGERDHDRALVAKMFCFREPEFTEQAAEDTVLRWGFDVSFPETEFAIADPETTNDMREMMTALASAIAGQKPPVVNIELAERGKTKRTVIRDDGGNIIGSEEEPA